MKIRFFNVFIFFLTMLVGGGLLSAYVKDWPELKHQQLIFATVGVDHDTLSNEESSYEVQRASEHFSDVILGWTIEPSFANELHEVSGKSLTYTGERQEKQNLMFKLDSEDSQDSDAFLKLLNERLGEYNQSTHANFTLAMVRVSPLETPVSKLRFMGGALLLLGLSTGVILFVIEYVRTHRRRWPWSHGSL